MRNSWLTAIAPTFLLIGMLGCASTSSYKKPGLQELKTLRTLAVSTKGEPEFSHTGSSTSESFGMVMLAGLVGAIVDSASRDNMDEDIAEAIRPEEILSRARQDFAGMLVKTLQDSQQFETVKYVENHNIDFDAVLDIEIVEWGTRIKQTDSAVIIPFMKVRISMLTLPDNKLIWNETQTITYDTHQNLYNYKQQEGLFKSDFQSLIDKAGERIATLLLDFYSV